MVTRLLWSRLVRTAEVRRPVRMSVYLCLHTFFTLGLLVAALSSALFDVVLDGHDFQIFRVLVDVEALNFRDVPGPPSVAMVRLAAA